MKKINITLLLLLIIYCANAQKEGNIWYFGSNAGLDFNSGTPVILTNGAINTTEGCSSISDSAGNLLFYTDGSTVWNSSHMPMANGTGLTGNNTSTQSAIILKQPGTQNIYFIFSLFMDYCYSVVDMTQNGGLGDVTSKNVIIMNAVSSEKQCATRHANGTDVWITMNTANSFNSYLLTASGFNPVPVVSTVGTMYGSGPGQMKVSPLGNKIAFGISGTANLCLMDFDNSTGIVSNNIDISNGDTQCYGLEFSPDGSKLYATGFSGDSNIFQYNLNAGSAAAIIASQVQLNQLLITNFDIGSLQIGPDRKIYACRYGAGYLGVINNPDSLGLACNFVDSAINLGTGICELGLPYLISDYFNSPLAINYYESKNQLSVFPNPFTHGFTVSVSNQHGIQFNRFPVEIKMYDVFWKKVLSIYLQTQNQKIQTINLSNGIYFLETTINGERIVKKMVKESD